MCANGDCGLPDWLWSLLYSYACGFLLQPNTSVTFQYNGNFYFNCWELSYDYIIVVLCNIIWRMWSHVLRALIRMVVVVSSCSQWIRVYCFENEPYHPPYDINDRKTELRMVISHLKDLEFCSTCLKFTWCEIWWMRS